jgi:hypothetical protein
MSVLATVLAAAEEAEPSKTAFYIVGGCLAVWAVLVGSIGIARPQFAASIGASRGVITITVLLVAGSLAAAVLTG